MHTGVLVNLFAREKKYLGYKLYLGPNTIVPSKFGPGTGTRKYQGTWVPIPNTIVNLQLVPVQIYLLVPVQINLYWVSVPVNLFGTWVPVRVPVPVGAGYNVMHVLQLYDKVMNILKNAA